MHICEYYIKYEYDFIKSLTLLITILHIILHENNIIWCEFCAEREMTVPLHSYTCYVKYV